MVTTPICCPSRVNLLRGQLSHNTNFTDVLGPHGGYAKFRALGLDREWLPVWLQRAGYNTLYTGKFIVDYTIRNRDPAPAGWSAFDALVHPFTFEYYCPAFSLNGGEPRMYPAQYVTDVLASKAEALLRSAAADPAGRPFYMQVAPPAPHHSMHYDYAPNGTLAARHWYPPVPAARHWELFSDAALPRPPSFNARDVGGKPVWVRALDRLTPGNLTFLEEVYRLRLRSLRAVDELVDGLMSLLSSLGLLDSTYVLFTSDNGYHEGPHRMGSGKTTALLAEFWGVWDDESIHSRPPYRNLTWKAVRLLRSDRAEAYKYVIHCNGEYELYDLVRDPYEQINLLELAAPAEGGEGAAGCCHGAVDGEGDVEQQRDGAVVRAWAATAWAALAAVTRGSAAAPPEQQQPRRHLAGEEKEHAAATAAAAGPLVAEARPLRPQGQSRHVEGRGDGGGGDREGSGGVDGGGDGDDEGYRVWLRRLRSRLDALMAVLAVCSGDSCVRPFQVRHGAV
ncbi:hypothetical protein GPECTOR_660g786 [Gonium pectorale]|uniref:Sulfatase N-terminal domain-containing protein n=1 Tax=Gonium pectorale TaxID=33097 RepID=A0A150FUD1_GONPE|nr:hypothetical protein GPECTOR_660g786 [Gonium pectorale]|eukprot:KXZ41196.1 hypothetical protein GPECTOR_660g786 [Gonium pectorale]